MCQDTGTAIVMGKKGQQVWTGGGDEAAIAEGIYKTYTETNLRYSQVSPLSMFKEVQTGTNLPAQIDIYATDGDAYKFLFIAKGGGSANKSFLLPADAGRAERGSPAEIPRHPDPHARHRGLPALSPRDRGRRHLGRDEPQDGEARLDALPRRPAERGQQQRPGHPRPRDGEEGARAHPPDGHRRAVRRQVFLPRRARDPPARHGASVPIGIGVSCSADRQALGKITRDGVFLEQLETNPAQYLPDVEPTQLGGRRRVGRPRTRAWRTRSRC